eukprot:scaffold45329_cov57-Attheya_sp.AAC.5
MAASSFGRARVLIAGSGRMGQIRASLVYANPRFELCGIIDVNLASAQVLVDRYSTNAFVSLSEAIDFTGKHRLSPPRIESNDIPDCGIDGLIISTPTFTHAAIIKESASLGISIFTEKPVDETADEIRQLFDICYKANVALCCGFQRRFDHAYVSTAKAVHDGHIDHPCPPIEFLLKGGNIFIDLSTHDIDYIRWVLQDEVESVYATGTSSLEALKEAGIDDNATMVMKFKKGAIVTLTMSRSACYGYDQRCEIFGDQGLVCNDNEYQHSSVLSNTTGVHQSRLKHSFPQRFNQAFEAELEAFADTILLGKPWPIKANDCIAVQKVSDAARKSREINTVVVIS